MFSVCSVVAGKAVTVLVVGVAWTSGEKVGVGQVVVVPLWLGNAESLVVAVHMPATSRVVTIPGAVHSVSEDTLIIVRVCMVFRVHERGRLVGHGVVMVGSLGYIYFGVGHGGIVRLHNHRDALRQEDGHGAWGRQVHLPLVIRAP